MVLLAQLFDGSVGYAIAIIVVVMMSRWMSDSQTPHSQTQNYV